MTDISKNQRPGFRECLDPFCHAYEAWGTHYHEDNVTDRQTHTTEIERLARQLADEIVPYECNRNVDLRALLLEFAKEIKLSATPSHDTNYE